MPSPESSAPSAQEVQQFIADFDQIDAPQAAVDPRVAGDFVYEGQSHPEVAKLDTGEPAKVVAVATEGDGEWSLPKPAEQAAVNEWWKQ